MTTSSDDNMPPELAHEVESIFADMINSSDHTITHAAHALASLITNVLAVDVAILLDAQYGAVPKSDFDIDVIRSWVKTAGDLMLIWLGQHNMTMIRWLDVSPCGWIDTYELARSERLRP